MGKLVFRYMVERKTPTEKVGVAQLIFRERKFEDSTDCDQCFFLID